MGYYLAIPKGVDRNENVAMAQKVIRQFVDDIDGSEAERTLSFAVDGIQYENLSVKENIQEFNEAIAGFVEAPEESKPKVMAAGPTKSVLPTAAQRSLGSKSSGTLVGPPARPQNQQPGPDPRVDPASIRPSTPQRGAGDRRITDHAARARSGPSTVITVGSLAALGLPATGYAPSPSI